MEGITTKDAFKNAKKAIHNDRLFNSSKDFTDCLKHIVLELSDTKEKVNKADEALAKNASNSIKALGCDLQRN